MEAYKTSIEREKLIANNNLVKNIAGLDKSIQIKGISTYRPNHWERKKDETDIEQNWGVEKTFGEVFAIIAPRIMSGPAKETQIKPYFISTFYKLATEDFSHEKKNLFTHNIDNIYLDKVKIQFVGLGLIEIFSEKTEKGAMTIYWKLTDKGYETMMNIVSVKK